MQARASTERPWVRLRHPLLFTGFLAILLGAWSAAASAPPRSRFLDYRPERVSLPSNLDQACWLSRDTLIGYFRNDPNFPQFQSLDLRSGKATTFPDPPERSSDVWVSPNKQRLVAFAGWSSQWIVTGLDGSPVMKRKGGPAYAFMQVFWLPDSSAWCYFEPGEHGDWTLLLYRLASNSPDADARYVFPRLPHLIGFPDRNHVLILSDHGTVDTYLLQDRAVLVKSLSFTALAPDLTPPFTVDNDRPLVKPLPFVLPNPKVHPVLTLEVTLSPDGKQLCWLLLTSYDSTPALLAAAGVPLPKTGDLATLKSRGRADGIVATFWLTSLDGDNKRMLSHVVSNSASSAWLKAPTSGLQITPRFDPLDNVTPGALTWPPDGSGILYYLERKLWAIPLHSGD